MTPIPFIRTIFVLAVTLLLTVLPGVCHAFHVAAISIPAYGHFMPMKGIAEKLLLRGHRVTLFVETESWCASELANNATYDCVIMPNSGTFSKETLMELSQGSLTDSFTEIFKEILQHNREQLGNYLDAFQRVHGTHPFDMILMDLSTMVGFSLSKKFDVPHVSVFPLTMHMAIGSTTYLPSLGTEYPRKMSFTQRLYNFWLKVFVSGLSQILISEMNRAHELHNIPPMRSAAELAGFDGLIFAPTIWGHDIPQPLCPNIVPLGAFSPSVEHHPIEPELLTFLDACANGAVYVNFGTLAVVGDSMFARVKEALYRLPFCVVWKVAEDDRRAQLPQDARFFVSKRFENPIAIMQHPSTHVFLTHCGDTSLMEAVQAELPLAGIPFFADQGDVCQRMDEAGIGRYVGHKHTFTADELESILVDVATSKRYKERIRDIHSISKLYGGVNRAADIIEERMANDLLRPDAFTESCGYLTEWSGLPKSNALVQEYDFLLIYFALIGLVCYGCVRCVRRCIGSHTLDTDNAQVYQGKSPSVKVVRRAKITD